MTWQGSSQQRHSLLSQPLPHRPRTAQDLRWAQSFLSLFLEPEAPSSRLLRRISLRTDETSKPIWRDISLRLFLLFSPHSMARRCSIPMCLYASFSMMNLLSSAGERAHGDGTATGQVPVLFIPDKLSARIRALQMTIN